MSLHKTVLLVDDAPSVCVALRRLLRDEHTTVYTARNGAEALTLLTELGEAFDLVVSDLDMPVMTGDALHKACAGLLAVGKIRKFLIMTGGTVDEKALMYLSAAEVEIIEKPFGVKAFLDVYRRHVRP